MMPRLFNKAVVRAFQNGGGGVLLVMATEND